MSATTEPRSPQLGPLVETRRIGRWTVHAIQAGGQKLDGGAMFGVVPKVLWQRRIVPDERNRIQLGMRCLLIEHEIGPVLIDTKDVRLPKVSAFGTDQLWTRRDTPSSWKDDPILAATQTALLPDLPYQVEEGYIRIAPAVPGTTGGTA